VSARPHSCKDVIDLLTEYMEGGLAPDQARALEAELARCVPCREFLDTLKRSTAALAGLRCDALPEECHRTLRDYLARSLPGIDPAAG
jgi:anti-sigma factor RsiW